jgi:hypothetical protein
MNIRFPAFAQNPFGLQLQQAFQTVSTAFQSVVSKDEGSERVLLRSPNGTIYAITTSDAGVLTTTAISGKTREI